jgi:hypothetical protein
MKADVALAIVSLAALGIGRRNPEQRLAVTPAGHVRIFILQLEAEKAEQLCVKLLRAGKIADTEDEVIDTDNAGHGTSPFVERAPLQGVLFEARLDAEKP